MLCCLHQILDVREFLTPAVLAQLAVRPIHQGLHVFDRNCCCMRPRIATGATLVEDCLHDILNACGTSRIALDFASVVVQRVSASVPISIARIPNQSM